MRRGTIFLLISVVGAVAGFPAAAQETPRWSSPLALGPTDATSVAARPGLILAGGRLHEKTVGTGTQTIPSPRTSGLFWSSDAGRSWSLGTETAGGGEAGGRPITETPTLVGLPPVGPDAYALIGSTMWRSEDDGRTWARAGSADPAATTLDFLADGRPVLGLAAGGLRVSSDRGETWTALGSGLPSRRVNEVLPLPGGIVLVATDGGLYRSADGGTSFSHVTAGLLEPGVPALGVTKESNSWTYLAMPAPPVLPGWVGSIVYHSGDQGQTWTPRVPPYSQTGIPRINPGAFDIVAQGGLYVLHAGTSLGLYRSGTQSDAATLWQRVEPEPGGRSTGEMAFFDADPGPLRNHTLIATVRRASPVVVTGSEVRLAGPGWIDEIQGGRVCGGLVTRADGTLFAACGRHVLRSADGGATWSGAGKGLPYSPGIGEVYFPLVGSADGSLWVSGFHDGLYHSDPDVTSWSKVAFPAASVGAMATHPSDPKIVFAAGLVPNGCCQTLLYRSTDGGTTWGRPLLEVGANIYTISVSPHTPNRVLVATHSGGGWLSEDGGNTWAKIGSLPSSPDALYGAVYSPAVAGVAYAVGRVGNDNKITIFRSNDGGRIWESRGTGASRAFSLYPSPWDADTLYTEGAGGIVVTRDGGATFQPFDQGIQGLQVDDVTFDRRVRGVVYAAAGVIGHGIEPQSMWVYRATGPEA